MLDTATANDTGISNTASGSFTGDGTICYVTLGFKPRYVKLVNLTDRITNEFFGDMAATHTLKTVAAGTVTDDTASAITPRGGTTDTYRGFEVAAATNITGKAFHSLAFG